MERYPTDRIEYYKTVGELRVANIAAVLKQLGLTVITREIENDDVDVWVCKDHELVLVIEVLNWRRTGYMDLHRVKSILANFSNPQYNGSRKLVVFSFWENIRNQSRFFKREGIDLLEIGYQTLPMNYIKFYENQREKFGIMPDDEETRDLLKRKLIRYLEKKGLV